MEKIIITNFGGIEHMEMELSGFNVFIGQQASGKSVTAKLIYFFKNIYRQLANAIIDEKSFERATEHLIDKFYQYFPAESFPSSGFKAEYIINGTGFSVSYSDRKIKLELPEQVESVYNSALSDLQHARPDNVFSLIRHSTQIVVNQFYENINNLISPDAYKYSVFVPAGRSYIAQLHYSIFTVLKSGSPIDPFILEFGSFYEVIKPNVNSTHSTDYKSLTATTEAEIIGAKFVPSNQGDYLLHKDGRKVRISYASSGQQEILPLAHLLVSLTTEKLGESMCIFIEEPEAHLFPSTQKKVVELITGAFNSPEQNVQIFLTTHSPYILTSINNLLVAGDVIEKGNNQIKQAATKIVPAEKALKPGSTSAFEFNNGTVKYIMDEENSMMDAEYIDTVSEDIAIEFDGLLELKYGKREK